jgi:hypothetical protein
MEFEWMYTTSDMTFKMFQELAMLAPDFEGEETEPLIDPVMYPVKKVSENSESSLITK